MDFYCCRVVLNIFAAYMRVNLISTRANFLSNCKRIFTTSQFYHAVEEIQNNAGYI